MKHKLFQRKWEEKKRTNATGSNKSKGRRKNKEEGRTKKKEKSQNKQITRSKWMEKLRKRQTLLYSLEKIKNKIK